jgi:thiol-disulfide isomerase/thioredoxin
MKMHFKLLAVLMPFAVASFAGADETFHTFQANGNTYTNVTITVVTATAIYFSYDGGMGNAKIKNLSPELQKHFDYNATKAAVQEKNQALANAQYQAHVSQAPVRRPADESREPAQAAASSTSASWGTDLPGALSQAQSQNKLVLMDFTGSDWCPWCMKLDHAVFSTSQFAAYAQNKLELVRVDFLRNTPQSDEVKQANAALASRYHVDGYPTCILLDPSGKELGRQVGYPEGGPDAFIAEFDGFSKK